MISLTALRAYVRFNGDPDGLALAGTSAEQESVEGDVWTRLAKLVMESRNLSAGHLSSAYAERVQTSIAAEFLDPVARAEFLQFVGRRDEDTPSS